MKRLMDAVPEVAQTLALAVVTSSTAPLVLLDGEFVILGASASFLQCFDLPESGTVGTGFFALGQGEWDRPKVRSLLGATLNGSAIEPGYEIDLDLPGRGRRRLVLNARVLDYVGAEGVQMLLSVADVTDARIAAKLKDDLLAEKAVLLQEVQHRVANSLQIIASVLMQGARKLGASSEARLHLQNAHHRVMSIAALQRQLAESQAGEVDLSAYLGQLCQSLGASMIEDHDLVTLTSTTVRAIVPANVSVSIGLVVTELVINALKHAFPDGTIGTVVVDYEASGGDWTLAVSDDGVGMPPAGAATAGLGTSIVAALAKHLGADLTVEDAEPGTRVALTHAEGMASDEVAV